MHNNKLDFYHVLLDQGLLLSQTQQVILYGTQSSPVNVTSEESQGSVLEPVLFLLFINDLTECIASEVRLFVDDAILMCRIPCQEDGNILQQDLNHLAQWKGNWRMQFNAPKCHTADVQVKKSNHPLICSAS